MQDAAALFLRSMIIGLSIAAPVGPIGVLCIRRTLAHGRLIGLVSGMGAASADAVYGLIAATGLTIITDLLLENTLWLQIGGGLFLAYLGIKTLLAHPAEETAAANERAGLMGAYLSIFALTITNPMTILAFVSIFAGLGTTNTGISGGAVVMVIGVFAGSALWWLMLSGGVSLFRDRVGPDLLLWVNRISGAIILIFAASILLQAITGG